MSSSARKISTSEWDRHKDLILDLYRVNTLKDVRAAMKNQHDFEARYDVPLPSLSRVLLVTSPAKLCPTSPWQYEVQLKRWNIRKNATRKEWQQYFAANDDRPVTTSPDDIDRVFSPVILGKSTASKKRASRWVSGVSVNSITPQASHSTQPSNGPYPPARLVPNGPYVPETPIEVNVQDTCLNIALAPGVFSNSPLCLERLFNSMSASNDVETHADSPRALFRNVDELTQSLDLISTPLPTYSSLVVPDYLSPYPGHDYPGRAIFTSLGIPAENNMIFFGMLKEVNFRRELPSGQLEHNLRTKGVVLNQGSGSTMLGGFAAKFVAGILSSNNHSTDIRRPTQRLQHFLRRLGSQVPGESSDIITNDQAFETKFVRTLLFSMLNGFAGLDDIPMENILRFLNRFYINNLLIDILKQCPQYALRTLADNIFRAAIEAADTEVLALLLSHKLVDVNETVCLYKGRKYIPIEQAAVLGCPKSVKSLIDAGADAETALEALLDDIGNHLIKDLRFNIRPDSCETLNLLVSAGAQVHPDMMFLGSGQRALEINFLISQNINPEHHQDFFQAEPGCSGDLAPVRYVAKEFDDFRAANSIQKAIDLCCQSNCNRCLASLGNPLRNAVIDAASRGKLETVRLLLDKFELKTELSRVLISAINSGSRPLVEFILSLGPELDPPALGKQVANLCDPTIFKTPIAETVRCTNVILRHELEERGCPKRVTEWHLLGALVQAAAEVGNVAYMRDLLACAVTSKKAYRESGVALALALYGGHEDIVQMLLEAGATFSMKRIHSWINKWESLVGALEKGYIRMVHALIASGALEKHIRNYATQADHSMIVDMALEYPGFTLEADDLEYLFSEFIKKDAPEAFRDLLQHLVPRDSLLENCLKTAVKIGHTDMIGYLLDIGANPFSDVVLQGVITDRPDMLPLLLQTEKSRRTTPKCIGASSLIPLMGHGAGNAEALDELIRIRAINFTRLEYPDAEIGDEYFQEERGHWERFTPLGMAIQGVPDRFESNMVTTRKFLDAGADPNGISKSKTEWTKGSPLMTGLMVAIETGLEEAVNLLLDYGADVNARPRIRTTRTALQYAAELGNLDMVRLLISRGADVNSSASPYGGATAVQFAAMSGNCNLVAYLLDHGAQLGALPSRVDGMWPLEGAAANGRLDMIRYLWELNVRLVAGGTFLDGFSERHCLRAMNFARENGHFGCRDFISDLSGIAVERLETDEYGAPWIAY